MISSENIEIAQQKRYMDDPNDNSIITIGTLYMSVCDVTLVHPSWTQGDYSAMLRLSASSAKKAIAEKLYGDLMDTVYELGMMARHTPEYSERAKQLTKEAEAKIKNISKG